MVFVLLLALLFVFCSLYSGHFLLLILVFAFAGGA